MAESHVICLGGAQNQPESPTNGPKIWAQKCGQCGQCGKTDKRRVVIHVPVSLAYKCVKLPIFIVTETNSS